MTLKILKKAFSNNQIACIYSNASDTTRFSVGYLIKADENDTLIAQVSPQGRYDGYVVKKTAEIFLIETGDRYSQKIETLFLKSPQRHLLKMENLDMNECDSILFSVLKYAFENELIVSIQLCNSGFQDITGFVKEMNAENVCIQNVDDFGNPNGEAYFLLGDVTNCEVDSEELSLIKNLFRMDTAF